MFTAAAMRASFKAMGAKPALYAPVSGAAKPTLALVRSGTLVVGGEVKLNEKRRHVRLLVEDVPDSRKGETITIDACTPAEQFYTVDAVVTRDEHTITVLVR
ncbi:head-tail joining protein [Hydrocarboniphaga sp.]|uniref:head-tail joining protein n=1 Tax=Hydrocarboniphaga sp. TaxID=2033016 RepID=UPI003D0FBD0F